MYGDVNSYEGRPTDEQVARTQVLGRELEDVIQKFQKLTSAQLSGINAGLEKQKQPSITVLTEADWQKRHAGGGPKTATSTLMRERD